MMATNDTAPSWRNFAAWSVMGALVCALSIAGAALLLSDNGLGALVRSPRVMAQLGLALACAAALIGFTSRSKPLTLRRFGNYALLNAGALALFLLAMHGLSSAGGRDLLGTMGASERVAAIAGLVLLTIALLGTFVLASVRAGTGLVEDELQAEELRDRGRLHLLSILWIAACGLLLILLALSGPGGLLPPATALIAAIALLALLTLLGIAVWRLHDELGRALSQEGGNMAFYLILLGGGGWTILAHLGFTAALAPLDWLTLFTVLTFAASFIVAGRRKLLTS